MFSTVWRSGWKDDFLLKIVEKWIQWFSFTFARSAKPFINTTFWGPFFDQNRKKAISTFGSKKVKMSSFFASGALLAPKTPQNRKVGPKAKKAILGVLGSKNVPRTLCLSLFCAWSESDAFSSFFHVCVFTLLARKMRLWLPKVAKMLKTLPIRTFASFCENGFQNT